VVKPKRSRRKKVDEPSEAEPVAANDANGGGESDPEGDDEDGPRRSGWWQRTFGN
jgi:hypothetical protein